MGVVVAFEDKDTSQGGIEPLVGLTRADMERVNAMILSRTGSEVTMIGVNVSDTADTALRLGARAVYPIEAREHLLLMLRRNADAIISDLNLHERCLPY